MSAEQAFAFVAAYESPCNRCGEPVTVSTAALEACKRSNHILKRMGEPLMSKQDIAMCRSCYDRHHERMWAQERVNSEAYERIWSNFRKAWRNSPDEKREMLEKKLRQGMGDYWASYSALLTAWKAEQETRRARGTNSSSKAGF